MTTKVKMVCLMLGCSMHGAVVTRRRIVEVSPGVHVRPVYVCSDCECELVRIDPKVTSV